MSFLNIKIEVDIIYNPIYNPLKSQLLSITIAQSEISDMILAYLENKVDKNEIEQKIGQVFQFYKIRIEDKTIGSQKLNARDKTSLEIFSGFKRLRIEVMV